MSAFRPRLGGALAVALAAQLATSSFAEEVPLQLSFPDVGLIAGGATSIMSDCDQGEVFDDGFYESGLSYQSTAIQGRAMMRFEPNGRQRLEKICVCWQRSGGSEDPLVYDLGVWASDGPGGDPGTLLGEVTGRQSGFIPLNYPLGTGTFASHDLSVLGIVTDQPIYVGPTWRTANAASYSLCIDTSPTTPRQPGFTQSESETGWTTPLNLAGVFPQYRAFGLRAVFADAGPLTACEPDSDTLCLNANRFSAEVDWHTTSASGRGQARVISGVDFSGLFWFFNPSNLELLLKVIDGCAVNGHYWVFWAGTTNVGFDIRVLDVVRGLERVYTNPLGTAARPTQDTRAFRCSTN